MDKLSSLQALCLSLVSNKPLTFVPQLSNCFFPTSDVLLTWYPSVTGCLGRWFFPFAFIFVHRLFCINFRFHHADHFNVTHSAATSSRALKRDKRSANHWDIFWGTGFTNVCFPMSGERNYAIGISKLCDWLKVSRQCINQWEASQNQSHPVRAIFLTSYTKQLLGILIGSSAFLFSCCDW